MIKAILLIPLLVLLVLGVFLPAISYGQMEGRGDALQDLENRLQQLEYKLNKLRRDFDIGSGATSPALRAAGVDAGGAPPPKNFAARVEIKMSELEQELARLTGQIEEQEFTVSSVSTRLDKLVEDVDFRLNALERGRAAAAGPINPLPQMPAGGAPGSVVSPSPLPPATPLPGTGLPSSLGTISPEDLTGSPDGQIAGAAPVPRTPSVQPLEPLKQPAALAPRTLSLGTPKEQYDFAYKLVRQGDYARAEVAFREFGELHPSDPLAGNAKYWLGETYYVRQNFVQAADNFIGVVTGYPDSPKKPHSMLKLGMSLLAMGQKQEGCATLDELLDSDSQEAAATRARAESERKRADCS